MGEQRFIAASAIRAEVAKFADDVLAESIGLAIGRVVKERFAEVDAKINGLEAAMKEFTFRGQWVEGKEYKRGNFCSVGGAIYFCSADTKSRPGNVGDWTWAVPRARDGKDGKDYVPPEPRTVRSGR
jgi:hypothetical protein